MKMTKGTLIHKVEWCFAVLYTAVNNKQITKSIQESKSGDETWLFRALFLVYWSFLGTTAVAQMINACSQKDFSHRKALGVKL